MRPTMRRGTIEKKTKQQRRGPTLVSCRDIADVYLAEKNFIDQTVCTLHVYTNTIIRCRAWLLVTRYWFTSMGWQ